MTSPTTTTDARDLRRRRNALQALREGRVRVKAVGYDGSRRAVTAAVEVHGFTGRHLVTYMGDAWLCTCSDSDGQRSATCAHVYAAQLVTGHAAATVEGP